MVIDQAPPGEEIAWLMQLIFLAMFAITIVYGQRIQFLTALFQVKRALDELGRMNRRGRRYVIKAIREQGKVEDPGPAVDRFMEHFLIMPEAMDPAGVVWKFEHIVNVRDSKFKEEVKAMAPSASESQINNMENMLEAALALNILYKIMRHFYLLGKRTKSFYIIAQLQMIMPMIMEYAHAYSVSLSAFAEGQPIGDGIGAVVAAKLLRRAKAVSGIAKDTIAGEVELDGRRVIALKAKGPGGNVGKPGDAVERLIEENGGKVDAIIMVDAKVKLEGEKSGSVAEGIGAAIGGIGVEKFKIEEVASKYKIPLYAVVVKESIVEAITPIKEAILNASNDAIEAIRRIINERVPEKGTVIVAGIGNTIGVS